MKKIILYIMSLILLVGCVVEDREFDPTVMPEATTRGANTFGCLIDGWIYAAGRYKQDWGAYHLGYSSHLFLYKPESKLMEVTVLVGMGSMDSDFRYMSFTILNIEENYSIDYTKDVMPPQKVVYTDARIGQKKLADGEVYITRFDTEEQIISGRFEGGNVTNGRFDVIYVVEEVIEE